MVGVIFITVTAGILAGSSTDNIAYDESTTKSSSFLGSSSAVDGSQSTVSSTGSSLNSTWRVELQHPAWIVWVDVNVPGNYGTLAISMTTTNRDTDMPCDATNTWITSTTLRITCRNVVNSTSITLISTDSTEAELGLVEVYVYGECPLGKYGGDCRNLCSNSCDEGACDHVNDMCTCVLGWKGDNCDGYMYNRNNTTHVDAALQPSINPLLAGLVGTGITAVVAVLVAIGVLLARRHRQQTQRTRERVLYDDIFNDINPDVNAQNTESKENQSESRGDYDVIDEPPHILDTYLTATSTSGDGESRGDYQGVNAQNTGSRLNQSESSGDYDVTDVTSRDVEEPPDKPDTEHTAAPTSTEGESRVGNQGVNTQNTGSQENQSTSRGVYDVLDVTSRDPDEPPDKPYTALTATPPPPEGESRCDYDVLDVASRDPDEKLDKPYTDLTAKS
ncbi:uncharacterized protein LOC124133221 [Haliotis rufescens]|uniref:uncharacterized protein LOC124133221 n=1 Tax=Haliotis rufescens TaxID=6454 RepID=UPI00201EDA45|nr:uncharacterized protein LOC124133221 [Haliotis rufescens]